MLSPRCFLTTLALWQAAVCLVSAGVYSYQPAADVIANPERGFYATSSLTISDLQIRAAEGIRLCYVGVNLQGWRTSQISPEKLLSVRQDLENVKAAGLKAIVRVLYSSAIGDPDTTLSWVQVHLEQLRPLFAEFDDVIALYQAGCVGAWGEWHSSHFLTSPADRRGVLDALLSSLPPSRRANSNDPGRSHDLR